MLSFKEKRAVQKLIEEKLAQLQGDASLSFREKRIIQKDLEEAFAKLQSRVEGQTNEKLQALIDGKYNDESPARFLAVLKEITDELNGDIEPVKPPVIDYIQKNADKASMMLEAATILGDTLTGTGGM